MKWVVIALIGTATLAVAVLLLSPGDTGEAVSPSLESYPDQHPSPSLVGASVPSTAAMEVQPPAVAATPQQAMAQSSDNPVDRDAIGSAPGLAADANPQVASVAEAAATGKHPERLTALVVPGRAPTRDDWSQPTYREAYLSKVEPGRIWHTAKPAKDVPYTSYLGENAIQVDQKTTVQLRFQSAPDAPLSLFSNGLGAFANGLTATTVTTDASGQATVPWTAIPGTVGDVTIVAASPFALQQASVAIEVVIPELAALENRSDTESTKDTH